MGIETQDSRNALPLKPPPFPIRPDQKKTPEQSDPEAKLSKQDAFDIRHKLGRRPDVSLPEVMRDHTKYFVRRKEEIWEKINSIKNLREPPSWNQTEATLYTDLKRVIQMIEANAKRLEQEKTKDLREVDWFKGTMNLLREGEKIIGKLDAEIQKDDPNWVSFEQEQRRNCMIAFSRNGTTTDLMKSGKNTGIQTLTVPDNVSVYAVKNVDFQELARPDEIGTEPEKTAFNPYARKISQYRKQIHLKILGPNPELKFQWQDTHGRNCERQVRGVKTDKKTWAFSFQEPEVYQTPKPEGRRRWFR